MKRGPYKVKFPECVQRHIAARYHFTEMGYGQTGDYFGGLSKKRVQRIARIYPADDPEVRRLATLLGLNRRASDRLRRELDLTRLA